jgi:hypothetical protein
MARLTAQHMAMLRSIHRRCPVPYEDTFRRDDVCSSLEDIKRLGDLVDAGMLWFKGYGGELGMVGYWTVTRAGAEAAGRKGPARAAETLSEPEPETAQARRAK